MMAAVLGAGLFDYLFRRAIHETLLSIAGILLTAFLLNAVVVTYVVKDAMPQ